MRPSSLLTPVAVAFALSLSLTVAVPQADAQARFGLRAGVSLSATADDEAEFRYEARDYRLSVADAGVGLHFGIYLQARLGDYLALQPEVLLHSTRTDYLLEELLTLETVESIRTERVSAVELPLMLAYRWGALRLQAGPVGRARVSQSSELVGVAGYVPTDESGELDIGYQAGVGLDLWRFIVDLKYDGSFENADATINIGGEEIAFHERASRTYLTLGYALFGGK